MHCGKKLGDVRIIHRTLCRSGFLLVTFYEFLVGQKKSTIGISSRCEKFVCLLVSAAYSIFGIFCFDQLKLGTSRNPDPCKILRMILPSPIFFTLCILGPHFLVSHENSKFWVTWLSIAQFVYFLREMCLLFNFWMIKFTIMFFFDIHTWNFSTKVLYGTFTCQKNTLPSKNIQTEQN